MASKLYQLLMNGHYELGVTVFAGLAQPTAQDYRWGGACQLRLGNLFQARQWLLTALAGGEAAANVDLATCLRFEGDFAAASVCLSSVTPDDLSPRDAALTYRERAILEQQQGGSGVMALLDAAWGHAVGAEPTVQAAVAQSIALVASQQGDDHKASTYLDFAELHASAAGRVYVQMAKSASAVHLGRLSEARMALEAAERDLACHRLSAALLAYYWGCWQRAHGEVAAADLTFIRAVALARKHQQPEAELYAQLGRVALATVRGDEAQVRASLARAQALARTPQARAQVQWRAGAALARQGDADGVPMLEGALTAFSSGGQCREVVWVWLHLAEARLRLDRPELAREALRQAADAHLALGGQQQLMIELCDLDRTQQLLSSLAHDAYERALYWCGEPTAPHAEVTMCTIARVVVSVNGQPVRFQMRKTVEILVYLLARGSARLTDMQGDLFSGVPPARSKNYIHQARLELRRTVPGLAVTYCPAAQTYAVEATGLRLVWDVQTLREALSSGQLGALLEQNINVRNFMPESDNDWMDEERERMSRWIVRVGLETMDTWYGQGDYAKCLKLAQRLLEVEPLDEALHVLLISATGQLSGASAARAVYSDSRSLFLREVGQVPDSLIALGERWRRPLLN